MTELAISNLEMVEEAEAEGAVEDLYKDIRQGMQTPFVPNLFKATAGNGNENLLRGTWEAMSNIYLKNSLPMSLKAMILYSIALSSDCAYCSSVHQVTCRTLGVDEKTLEMLTNDLSGLEPRRLQAIINFAVKVASEPTSLTEEDYDNVRDMGVGDDEITEIIGLAAFGKYLDILADAFKIDVDLGIKQALEQ